MSIQAANWVISHSQAKGGEYTVLLMIALHANSVGTGAWPSLETLANEARLSRRQVIRCIKNLVELGELKVQVGHGPYGTNLYSLTKLAGDTMSPPANVTRDMGVTTLVTSAPVSSDTGVTQTNNVTVPEPSVTLSTAVDPPLPQTAKELLAFLNTKTGRNYPPVKTNIEMLVARLKEGYTPKQVRQVIAKKCAEWETDEKMAMYLRPKTLFNRTNFANYVGELVPPKESQ